MPTIGRVTPSVTTRDLEPETLIFEILSLRAKNSPKPVSELSYASKPIHCVADHGPRGVPLHHLTLANRGSCFPTRAHRLKHPVSVWTDGGVYNWREIVWAVLGLMWPT
jgi:hypothetical protein